MLIFRFVVLHGCLHVVLLFPSMRGQKKENEAHYHKDQQCREVGMEDYFLQERAKSNSRTQGLGCIVSCRKSRYLCTLEKKQGLVILRCPSTLILSFEFNLFSPVYPIVNANHSQFRAMYVIFLHSFTRCIFEMVTTDQVCEKRL